MDPVIIFDAFVQRHSLSGILDQLLVLLHCEIVLQSQFPWLRSMSVQSFLIVRFSIQYFFGFSLLFLFEYIAL